MEGRGWPGASVAVTGAAVLAGAALAAPAQAASPADDVIIHAVQVRPQTTPVETGFTGLTIEVEMSHPEGLEHAEMTAERRSGVGPDPAAAASPGYAWDRSWNPWADAITWELQRVSGDATSGVWQGSALVTRAAAGAFVVSSLTMSTAELPDLPAAATAADGPEVAVAPDSTWQVSAVAEPLRIVTGEETYRPRARVTDRATGRPVAGAAIDEQRIDVGYIDTCYGPTYPCRKSFPARVESPPRTGFTDAYGLWTSPSTFRAVEDGTYAEHLDVGAYGARGSRGYSLEATGVTGPGVKRQANSRYSATSLDRGQTLRVEGNAWPAPAIFETAGARPAVSLQRLDGRTWRTVATSGVRSNGRYDLTWVADTEGTQHLRVRVPGGTTSYGAPIVGTNLAAVPITVR